MRKVIPKDLGLIDYQEAWSYQEKLFKTSIDLKIAKRKNESEEDTKNYLLLCEHPHVYTLGKSGSENNLLLNHLQLTQKDAKFYKINRGGDITYHGPGQLVVYPVFDLDHFFTDIHKYLRFLEEAVILTLKEYNVIADRVEGLTGVWIEGEDPDKARKVCAMGVKCSRWVTMHGIGFNINTDLNYFNNIVPCGIVDKKVTSLEKELGRKIDMNEIKQKLMLHISNIFDFSYVKSSSEF